jgi:hypothetical protein
VPQPPPQVPRYETRTLPLCPQCKGLARREILAMTNEGQQYGPWSCDIHGAIALVEYEELEIPVGDES